MSDNDLRKIVSILRLALPYSHIFISTREDKEIIFDLLQSGGGNITASKCSVSPGYVTYPNELAQFKVFNYELEVMEKELKELEFTPTLSPPVFDNKILKELSESIRNEEVAIFIGSGFSYVASEGKIPNGVELSELLQRKVTKKNMEKWPLDKAATYYEFQKNRKSLIEFLKPILDKGGATHLHKMVAEILPVKQFITTNYDRHLEDSIKLTRGKVSIVENEDDILNIDSDNVVYKIHGSLQGDDNLVISENDFQNLEKKNPYLYKKLNNIFMTKKILFLGYSIEDSNIVNLIYNAKSKIKYNCEKQSNGVIGNRHFAVMKNPSTLSSVILNSRDIHIFNMDLAHFLSILKEKLKINLMSHIDIYEWLWQVRTQLELFSVQEAVKNRDKMDIDHLNELLIKFKSMLASKKDNEVLWEYDFQFHKDISKSGKNILLMDIVRIIYSALKPLSQQEQSYITLHQHKTILRAICDRDENKAKEAITTHINYVKDKWRKRMAKLL